MGSSGIDKTWSKLTKLDGPIMHLERREPDMSEAKRLLGGWRPIVPLKEGLAKAIPYFERLLSERGITGYPAMTKEVNSRAILVTGGAGYVGAHTCKALRRAGFTPIVFDNLSTGHRDFVRWGPLIVGDIRDRNTLLATISHHRAEAVMHFAACAYVGESVTEPQKYYENNVSGSLSLLSAMFEVGCRKLVFSSSCSIYGEPHELPIRETALQNPVNPYGASKAMVERVLSDYARAYPLQFIALRYFNASGADPEGDAGELRDPETHLIPRAMMAIQGHINDFAIFGADYGTPDGTPIRDYIHVSDLADAHVAALRRLLAGATSGSFNLGTGRGYSVKQVLDAITAETGESLPVSSAARREGDPPVLVADGSLSRTELGFVPRLSDLKTIVETAWAWHRQAHPRLINERSTTSSVEPRNFT
jgi:UDP-arabinose 4-epimerase